tara:strand:- start:3716 stop:3991 length:276 start_codon:yes stop_codon:yes gene_type:complete
MAFNKYNIVTLGSDVIVGNASRIGKWIAEGGAPAPEVQLVPDWANRNTITGEVIFNRRYAYQYNVPPMGIVEEVNDIDEEIYRKLSKRKKL